MVVLAEKDLESQQSRQYPIWCDIFTTEAVFMGFLETPTPDLGWRLRLKEHCRPGDLTSQLGLTVMPLLALQAFYLECGI